MPFTTEIISCGGLAVAQPSASCPEFLSQSGGISKIFGFSRVALKKIRKFYSMTVKLMSIVVEQNDFQNKDDKLEATQKKFT